MPAASNVPLARLGGTLAAFARQHGPGVAAIEFRDFLRDTLTINLDARQCEHLLTTHGYERAGTRPIAASPGWSLFFMPKVRR